MPSAAVALVSLVVSTSPLSDAPQLSPVRISELAPTRVPVVEGTSAPVRLAQADVQAETESSEGDPLRSARRFVSELRYEEAVVEYQRYLALPGRPLSERARALFELGFVYLVLGDERSAQLRAFEALEMDPSLRLAPDAPSKQAKFLQSMREKFESRTRIEVLPPEDPDAPQRIRARVIDPTRAAKTVMLRHAIAATGPYWGQAMRCEGEICSAEIPLPRDTEALTAWYYVEASDAQGNTVATGSSPEAPLRVSIVQKAAWYQSPWVYAGGAAAVITAAAIFYAASAR